MTDERTMLTVSEAARLIRYSPDSIQNWIRLGRLPAIRAGSTGPYRVDIRDLRDHFARSRPT